MCHNAKRMEYLSMTKQYDRFARKQDHQAPDLKPEQLFGKNLPVSNEDERAVI